MNEARARYATEATPGVNGELLYQLSQIFQDADSYFLQDLCKNKIYSDDTLHRLVCCVFNMHDYPKSSDMKLAILANVIPDADPTYFLDNLRCIRSEDDLNMFVEDALDSHNYPAMNTPDGYKIDEYFNGQYDEHMYNTKSMEDLGLSSDDDNESYSSMPNKRRKGDPFSPPQWNPQKQDVYFGAPILGNNNRLLYELMNMFPDAEPSYMRTLCGNKPFNPKVVDQLITVLFSMPDYPKSKPRQFEILANVLPDADEEYLRTCLARLNTQQAINDFIGNALENHDYPIKEGYVQPEEKCAKNDEHSNMNTQYELSSTSQSGINLSIPQEDFAAGSSSMATQGNFPLASTSSAPQKDVAMPSTSNTFQVFRKPSTSKAYHDLQELSIPDQLMSITEKLIQGMLPNAIPEYLMQNIETCTLPEQRNEFIINAMETGHYPTTRAQPGINPKYYQVKQYTENFTIENFLHSVPDPEQYFNAPDYYKKIIMKKNSIPHMHCLNYLQNYYLKLPMSTIKYKFSRRGFNLMKTCKDLEKIDVGHRKSRVQVVNDLPPLDHVEVAKMLAYVTHEYAIKAYIQRRKQQDQIERAQCRNAGTLVTCDICCRNDIMTKELISCPGGCSFCKSCVEKYVEISFGNGNLQYSCMADCDKIYTSQSLKEALNEKLFLKISQMIQIEEIKSAGIEELEGCPFCDFMAILDSNYKVFNCLNPDCMAESCRECKHLSHIPLRCNEIEQDVDVKNRVFVENKMTEALLRECPKCKRKIIKSTGGCNKITCPCGTVMCYVCKKVGVNYQHFNGQGGDRFQLCPLWCDINLLHQSGVLHAAETAMSQVGTLKINPAADIRQHYSDLQQQGIQDEF